MKMVAASDMMKLWFWPWEAARVATELLETAVATQSVLGARLPMISTAATNPLAADHRELSLMMSEKVDAFGKSGRTVSRAAEVVQQAASANARDWGRAAAGTMLTPGDWIAMAERNLLIATTLMLLPAQALAPVRKGVKANARRLRNS